MTIQETERPLRGFVSALGIVAVAYAANGFFNHTTWGLRVKSYPDAYVFAFFLPFGVVVPAAYIGWAVKVGHVPARRLGARIGWRDGAAAAVALAIGGDRKSVV